ncbi:MAG TPA: gamma-glutamylcyclotransferase [Chitinophagaceae bacterium]
MLIFAYGSNMDSKRLTERVSSAKKVVTVFIKGYQLQFNKVSSDGSGKANMVQTTNYDDIVWGVIYEIHDSEKIILDEFEGLGKGYNESQLLFTDTDGNTYQAQAYLGDVDALNDALLPFDWYKVHCLSGAIEHQLPEDYINKIKEIKCQGATDTSSPSNGSTATSSTTPSTVASEAPIVYNKNFGSQWLKWDLHFHTQTSHDYKKKSLSNQEIIDSLVKNNVSVVAITDHHTMDIDRIRDLQKIGAGKIVVLPGIEYRAELGGSESIHFIGIFSEKCDLDDIWIKLQSGCGITPTDIIRKGGDEKIYCDLANTCDLIHKLGGIVSVHAGAKTNTIENITNSLSHKMALKTDLVLNHIDILELGKETDQDRYNKMVFPTIKFRRPMIICSDNHDCSAYLAKQNLWIKAEPTFEGLKQILFEPEHRVHIGQNPPINPPIRIEKVTLDFPTDSTFEGEVFCLSGKNDIHFSPNFTCIIGGRGTGKSTILNLIHEKLSPGQNQFFKERKIRDKNGNIIPIQAAVSIDNDIEEKYVEFLSQNEVEEFAKDHVKLTSAIYSRILKRDDHGLIGKAEAALKDSLDAFRTHIVQGRTIDRLTGELEQLRKELQTNKKIVDSFSSAEYLKITEEIKALTGTFNDLNNSRLKYLSLVSKLEGINDEFKQETASNPYSTETARLLNEIQRLLTESSAKDFSSSLADLERLNGEVSAKGEELRNYLATKGLTPDNLNDIANANIQINTLESDIEKKRDEIAALQKKLDSFKVEDNAIAAAGYVDELQKQIKVISQLLENIDSVSVKPISLSLDFAFDDAKDKLFADFKQLFEGKINQSKHKGDSVLKEVLFSTDPTKLTTKAAFLAYLNSYYSQSSAKPFLLELLDNDANFEAYRLLALRTFNNWIDFKRINVQYDKRPIEKSSFGQRCTAVMVILLLLGNTPIIIDEPEAHLDSHLIANYLVDVIKKSKQNRQIIFATHNANFVINGDAELIHILEIADGVQITMITPTTIENETTRDTLIGLEGGRDAFLKREDKYQL